VLLTENDILYPRPHTMILSEDLPGYDLKLEFMVKPGIILSHVQLQTIINKISNQLCITAVNKTTLNRLY